MMLIAGTEHQGYRAGLAKLRRGGEREFSFKPAVFKLLQKHWISGHLGRQIPWLQGRRWA